MSANAAAATGNDAKPASNPASVTRAVAAAKLRGIKVRAPVRIQNAASVICSAGTAKKLRACRRSCKVAGQARSVSAKLHRRAAGLREGGAVDQRVVAHLRERGGARGRWMAEPSGDVAKAKQDAE
jgi:hypothetical protein